MLIGKGNVENLAGVPLLDLEIPLFSRYNQLNKRIFDIVFSSILILLTVPLHFYFILTGNVAKDRYWYLNGQCIEIFIYNSGAKILHDLPILFMIFAGKISFVGSELINITKNDPSMIIKPGLTGLPHLKSTCNKHYSKLYYEQFYAVNYSIFIDIEIIFKTILKL